ncbi:hypothetical protein EV193_10163 [Herbihabitans rhizosphaerae]|uniref:Metalloprotease n=1 Tax=Herbihabitans rhizosphaerae TaxID=1872711 RepID=A0A4Q7L3K1_9PSEU|nr:hypothetical protein EV193_10163 [Herbihabitans rhizosphaerae]
MAIVLVALLVLGAGIVGVFLLTDKDNDDKNRVADSGYTGYTTTSASETTTRATSSTTTTRSISSTSATSRTTASSTSRSTQTAPAGPRPVHKLADHPLHANVGLPATSCDLPRWVSNPAASQTFFRAAVQCLNQAWAPVLNQANLPFEPPGLEFPTGTVWRSPCKGSSTAATAAAFYCSVNNTIYMPFEGLGVDRGPRVGWFLLVFAHEYGHHVQSLTGIAKASHNARYDAGDGSAKELELSRRHELQAECFAGMWFASSYKRGSVDQRIVDEALESSARSGDREGGPRTHGTSQNTGAWSNQGLTKNRTFQCNTWSVNGNSVS